MIEMLKFFCKPWGMVVLGLLGIAGGGLMIAAATEALPERSELTRVSGVVGQGGQDHEPGRHFCALRSGHQECQWRGGHAEDARGADHGGAGPTLSRTARRGSVLGDAQRMGADHRLQHDHQLRADAPTEGPDAGG
jgi:hypothetical protein